MRRYSRHLIIPDVGVTGQKRLKNAKVLCVGAGGLGSPALMYLAAAGVGTLGIVDDDVVDVSNLQRQVIHTTDRVGLAGLTWRYPLIIDRGGASVFSLFPAVFVRQLDLELFGTGAVDQRQDLHAAGGGELILHLEIWHTALQLGFQVARRIRDDEAATTLLELGAGL